MKGLGRTLGGALVCLVVAACYVGASASPAGAHPLGNFSVNHLDVLTFTATRVIDDAVIDTAEIPTAQSAGDVDVDGDGVASPDELAAYGASRCDDFNGHVAVTVEHTVVAF